MRYVLAVVLFFVQSYANAADTVVTYKDPRGYANYHHADLVSGQRKGKPRDGSGSTPISSGTVPCESFQAVQGQEAQTTMPPRVSVRFLFT